MPGWTRGPGIPVSMAVPGRGAHVKPQRPEPTGWGEGQSRPSAPVCFGRPGARSEDLASRSPWPGAGPFPVLGPVPGLAPNSRLRADCPLCSPLPPDGEAPVGSETASQAMRIQERFYFSSSWVARKDYKSQLGYPRPHNTPAAQSQNRHRPLSAPPEVTDIAVRILHPSAPPPPALPSSSLWPCWSSGPGPRSPARWPGLGSWESGAEAGGCGPRPRATGGRGSSPCSVKRS